MDKREVDYEEGKAFAKHHQYIFTETSALDSSFKLFLDALQNSLRSYSEMYKLGNFQIKLILR